MTESVLRRDMVDEIIEYLDTDNIIVLHGARQVGKTSIMLYLRDYLEKKSRPAIYFDLEDFRFRELLDEGVEAFLAYLKNEGVDLAAYKKQKSKFLVFIDEIQYLADPSPFLKLLADHHKYLQLIVSGSSSFDIQSKFSDSLVGRTVNFEVFNLSFKEVLRFKNVHFDLRERQSAIHLEKLMALYQEYLLFGGYPKIVLEDSVKKKGKYLEQIIDTYIRKDIRDLAQIKDIQKFNNLLKFLASRSGKLLNIAEICEACSLARQTVQHYLSLLENTYILQLVPPYSSSVRVEVVKAPKVFFFDTGLLQMLWLRQLQKENVGPLFETSVFAELVKKYGRRAIYFWRTKNQQEVDFVVNVKNKLMPIEVKENFRKTARSTINLFQKRYGSDEGKVIALSGEKKSERAFYPWEI